MQTIGVGGREIRIQSGRSFRVFCAAKFAEAIYFVHGFEKKSQSTAKRDLELAQQRLAELTRSQR